MNRKQRRSVGLVLGSADAMAYLVARMASEGPEILKQLREAVGATDGTYTAGHAVDALMSAAATAERAAGIGDADAFTRAAVAVLFLARDIAISQGKITHGQPSAEPS